MTNKTCRGFWQKGVTIIELIVVLAILGILIVIWAQWVNPRIHIGKAKEARQEALINEVLKATLRYYQTHGSFPGITEDQYDFATGTGVYEGTGCHAIFISETDTINVLIQEGEVKSSMANEDLFDGEGNDDAAILLEPAACDCQGSLDFCQYLENIEGPWLCLVPYTDEDRQAAKSIEGNDLVHIETGSQACTIFDPEKDVGCHVSTDHDWSWPISKQPCWRCLTP